VRQRAIFKLLNAAVRQSAVEAVRAAPDGFVVRVEEPNRTLDQNAAQWPILHAFAEQLQWPVNGVMASLSPNEWKDVLTAAFKQEMVRVVPSLDGRGMVMLGMRTREFGKREFSEWLEFLHAVAADRGVVVYDETRFDPALGA